MHRNTTDELDDHINLKMSTKTTQGNPYITLQKIYKKKQEGNEKKESEISGIDMDTVTEDKIDTKGSTSIKESKRKEKVLRQSMQG